MGLAFRIRGLQSKVQGLEFRVQGLEFKVQGLEVRVGRASFHELKYFEGCIFLMLWDPMGGWVFFYVLRQLLLERMLGLEMLNPKP